MHWKDVCWRCRVFSGSFDVCKLRLCLALQVGVASASNIYSALNSLHGDLGDSSLSHIVSTHMLTRQLQVYSKKLFFLFFHRSGDTQRFCLDDMIERGLCKVLRAILKKR